MSVHDYWAARFEAEGWAAFHNSTGGNPYNANTMAHDRWAKGFMDGASAHRQGQMTAAMDMGLTPAEARMFID